MQAEVHDQDNENGNYRGATKFMPVAAAKAARRNAKTMITVDTLNAMTRQAHVSKPTLSSPGQRTEDVKRLWRPRSWCLLLSLVLPPILWVQAVAAPTITITNLPLYATGGFMHGTVTGVDFSQYQVASFLYVPGLGWYRKPYDNAPTVPINPDGTWSANVNTGGLDSLATIYGAWLVPTGYIVPPSPPGNYRVPAELDMFPLDIKERYGPIIQFANRTWAVKDAPAPVGPQANYFSPLASDVWADAAGLHLSIHQHADGIWWATEVTLLGNRLGYGTYWYQTNSRTDLLDVNVTFGGGFDFDDFGDEASPDGSHNREIDIGEDSRWGIPTDPNTQNVKQPFDYPPANGANRHRFNLPDLSSDPALTRIVIWRSDSIRFITLKGHYTPDNYPPQAVVNEYIYTHDPAAGRYVPMPGRERLHFNLWLNKIVNPIAPTDGQPVGVIIKDFGFTPPPTTTSVASSANPSVFGASVTFTATVTGSAPTGTVAFTDGGSSIAGCSAVALSGGGNTPTAACSSSSLSVGIHNIVAMYGGDANNAGSNSAPLSQVVNSNGGTSVNVALASAGAVAFASSTFSASFPVSAINNGDRAGLNFGAGGVWKDATANAFPDWVEIDFSSAQTIDRVIVYSLQDNYTNPVDPSDTLTFTQRGLTAFDIQAWNGTAWVTVGSVSANKLIKRTVSFTATTTSKIRVLIKAAHGGKSAYSFVTEVEAWTAGSTPPPPPGTTLVSSLNPAKVNQSVTFAATVTGTNPSGSVAFTRNGGAIAGCTAVPLTGSGNSRTASCTTSFATTGTYSIVASYSGDANNAATSSTALSEVVKATK